MLLLGNRGFLDFDNFTIYLQKQFDLGGNDDGLDILNKKGRIIAYSPPPFGS